MVTQQITKMTDLWLVMFTGGLVASCGSTAWVSYWAWMSRLQSAHGRAAAHGKPVKSRVFAHLSESRGSHGLVLQHRYFKLFICIMYMQQLHKTHLHPCNTHNSPMHVCRCGLCTDLQPALSWQCCGVPNVWTRLMPRCCQPQIQDAHIQNTAVKLSPSSQKDIFVSSRQKSISCRTCLKPWGFLGSFLINS